jgi:hypothetical protein
VLEVFEELRLIDRLDRSQAHRHRRHLPVIRHQPWVRIRRQRPALASDFHAEQVELIFGQPTFEERTRVDARAGMALMKHQVARVIGRWRAPEMVEADVVQRGAGREAGDMAAQLARLAVGAHDHGHGVPADQRTDTPFHRRIAGHLRLVARRDGVDVFGGRVERQVAAGTTRVIDHALEQEMRTLGAIVLNHRIERIHPLAGFGGVDILIEDVVELIHGDSPRRRCGARA